MIYGIGIDIVKIDRIGQAVERWGERFLRRIFTDAEIAYAYDKKSPYPSLAVRFAAKEALIKALGSLHGAALTDIEITGNGAPVIRVKGRLLDLFRERSIKSSHVSLSHEREYGVACVVVETH